MPAEHPCRATITKERDKNSPSAHYPTPSQREADSLPRAIPCKGEKGISQ